MTHWDNPEIPSGLLYFADVEGYTKNTSDWQYHGEFVNIPETVSCNHRGLHEPAKVMIKRVELENKEVCGIGRCEICGMVHWLTYG